MGKIKSSVSEEPADSFTSMIDIVFLLLIFFICQPFKEPELKLGANLPQNSSAPSDPVEVDRKQEDIRINIRSMPASADNATIYIDGRKAGIGTKNIDQALVSRIASMLKQSSLNDKDAPIAILPSQNVHIRHVLTVLDACYAAQMPNIKFGFGN